MTPEEERKNFESAFYEKTGESIQKMELAELRAAPDTYRELGLKLENFQATLWGLVIDCGQNKYFYITPHENFISFFVRKSSGEDGPKDQLALISRPDISFCEEKKSFLNILFPEKARTLKGKFMDKEGRERFFEIVFNKKLSEIGMKF